MDRSASAPPSFPHGRMHPLMPVVAAMVAGCSLLAAGCAAHGSVELHSGNPHSSEHTALVLRAAAPDPVSADEIEEVRWLTAILMNPGNDRATRSGAAFRLMNMGLPEAMQPLREALLSKDSSLTQAVIEALGDVRIPVPELLEPLVEALRRPPDGVLGPLALAVARYGDAAFERVRVLARDTELSNSERLGPIYALGTFRNQAAAIELVAMLEGDDESERIIAAVCEALRRGTGLPYGDDPEQWKQWWSDARDQPPQQWLTNLVQRLAEQLAAEQQQVEREREAAAALERRIGEILRDYFPMIRDEEQMRRLPVLMEDRLASVRAFALDRISRLLRDSIKIPDEVQLKLAELLDDEDIDIRRRTARLLDQLNVDSAGERIARRLAVEPSPEVAGVLMDILVKRPTVAAIDPIRVWILEGTPALSARAAAVAWEVTGSIEVDESRTVPLRDAVWAAGRWHESPEHARLLAALGDSGDLHEVESLLDGDDVAMRRAVAEALLRRTVRRPLIDRAADEVIYPYALRSLGRAPVDMTNARRALGLQPRSDGERVVWYETMAKIAGKLAPQSVVELDDLLTGLPEGEVTPQLRSEVLKAGKAASSEQPNSTVRVEIHTRLAQQYLLLDQPLAAFEVMETINGQALSDTARQIKFEAAALSGNFDLAAQLVASPETWMALLARVTNRNAGAAVGLRDEIDRRFGNRLEGDLKAEFDRLTERLSRERVEASGEPSA